MDDPLNALMLLSDRLEKLLSSCGITYLSETMTVEPTGTLSFKCVIKVDSTDLLDESFNVNEASDLHIIQLLLDMESNDPELDQIRSKVDRDFRLGARLPDVE